MTVKAKLFEASKIFNLCSIESSPFVSKKIFLKVLIDILWKVVIQNFDLDLKFFKLDQFRHLNL